MPTRRTAKTVDPEKVTIEVVAPHAVYWDGEQRGGTLTDVDREVAQHWVKHGWATITETTPPEPPPTK